MEEVIQLPVTTFKHSTDNVAQIFSTNFNGDFSIVTADIVAYSVSMLC